MFCLIPTLAVFPTTDWLYLGTNLASVWQVSLSPLQWFVLLMSVLEYFIASFLRKDGGKDQCGLWSKLMAGHRTDKTTAERKTSRQKIHQILFLRIFYDGYL